MSHARLLVLGTQNQKKGRELLQLLGPYGFELRTLADYPNAVDVEETGSTFAENAALKACQQAVHLNEWVLGEDSGISVDALDGAPGIFSARYAGQHGNDEANNEHLLQELANVPPEKRSAHYTCHVTLSDPTGTVQADCEAYCRGRIRFERAGTGGFGYDPLFEILECHRTFGELGNSVKSMLSHRGRALRMFVPQLLRLVRNEVWPLP